MFHRGLGVLLSLFSMLIVAGIARADCPPCEFVNWGPPCNGALLCITFQYDSAAATAQTSSSAWGLCRALAFGESDPPCICRNGACFSWGSNSDANPNGGLTLGVYASEIGSGCTAECVPPNVGGNIYFTPPAGACSEIAHLEGGRCGDAGADCHIGPPNPIYGDASVTLGGRISITLTPLVQNTSPSWSLNIYGTVDDMDVPSLDYEKVVRQGTVVQCGGQTIMFCVVKSGKNRGSHGMTLDKGMWTGSATITGQSTLVEPKVWTFSYDDSDLDVNSDGRFSPVDVSALQLLVGTKIKLDQFDFDGSTWIDAPDVQFLQDLVSVKLDSGMFGDVNHDGVYDCDDINAMYPVVHCHLGDAAYKTTLDCNLDGVIDQTDEDAIDYLILLSPLCD